MPKIYATNKKAHFNYEFLKIYNAGIQLKGYEVKAIKTGLASLQGAFVIIRGGEAYLTNTTVPPYQKANTPSNYKEDQPRKLLLQKKEILELEDRAKQKGLTLVAIKLYNNRGLVKLEFAVAKGKKKYDKREILKKRESDRKINRTLKNMGVS